MAEQILFDRLTYINRLKRAGIAEDQARAHAEAMDDALREAVATRTDILVLKADIESLRASTKTDIQQLKTELENKIELTVRDMTIRTGWMIGPAVAILAGLMTIFQFLGKH